MAKFGNRVKETTDTTGTGTLDLNGAPTGFRGFGDEFISGDQVYYSIVDDPDNPTDYEHGVGTFTSGTPDTLSRDSVEGSSNSDNKVSWAAGTKTVIATPTAAGLGGKGPPFISPTTTRGDLIARGASADQRLALGVEDSVLVAGADDPAWMGLSALLDAVFDDTQGAILYRGSTAWAALAPGTDGQVLQSKGASADPAWADIATGITIGTEQAASGTAVDFTSIPAGTKRITITFEGISTNGTSNILVQIGDSGGIETTGYVSAFGRSAASPTGGTSTAGFIMDGGNNTSNVSNGLMTLVLSDPANNTWVASHAASLSSATGVTVGGGSKSLSATLDRVRITAVNGTDTFDAGSFNILYE